VCLGFISGVDKSGLSPQYRSSQKILHGAGFVFPSLPYPILNRSILLTVSASIDAHR
jgi:hypothetical protein